MLITFRNFQKAFDLVRGTAINFLPWKKYLSSCVLLAIASLYQQVPRTQYLPSPVFPSTHICYTLEIYGWVIENIFKLYQLSIDIPYFPWIQAFLFTEFWFDFAWAYIQVSLVANNPSQLRKTLRCSNRQFLIVYMEEKMDKTEVCAAPLLRQLLLKSKPGIKIISDKNNAERGMNNCQRQESLSVIIILFI